MHINTVAIVGVGLIGGSLAAAWRACDFAARIVGIEVDSDAAQAALSLGLVDEISEQVPAHAELTAICTSSDQIARCIADLSHHAGVLFDVGSVKAPIVESLVQQFGALPPRFVPCHPIAGSEHSGPGAARADLFRDSTTVITPSAATDASALEMVRSAWRAVGASVVELSAAEHDEMLAVTSHLPHLLAFTFMQQVDARHLDYTGGGFRDFTRIAAANPQLWWRILSMNKTQVLAAAEQFGTNLEALTRSLAADDAQLGLAALNRAVVSRRGQES